MISAILFVLLLVVLPHANAIVCPNLNGNITQCCLPALPSGDTVCTTIQYVEQYLYFDFCYNDHCMLGAQYSMPTFAWSDPTQCMSDSERSACFSPVYTTFIPSQVPLSPACGTIRASASQDGTLVSDLFYFQLLGDCPYNGPTNPTPSVNNNKKQVEYPANDTCHKCGDEDGCIPDGDNNYICCGQNRTICIEVGAERIDENLFVDSDVEFYLLNWMYGDLFFRHNDTVRTQIHCTTDPVDWLQLAPLCVNYTQTSHTPFVAELSYTWQGATYPIGTAAWKF